MSSTAIEMSTFPGHTSENTAAAAGVETTDPENVALLEQNNTPNGETNHIPATVDQSTEGQNTQKSCLGKIKANLNEKAFWKVKVWMVFLFLLLVIAAVIVIFLVLCRITQRDEDEEYDSSLFVVPLYFNGSFQMSNHSFNETEKLNFDKKLVDLYRSSPALGRYFSEAQTYPLRKESVIVLYNLTFMLPENQLEELRNFTVSREVVKNVFRQFLYDQDPVKSGDMFIDPVSLKMSVMQ